MLSLIKSSQFQIEYKEFFSKIQKIPDDQPVKQELTAMLNQLLQEVKSIDIQHQELTMMQSISSGVNDSKRKITEIRRQLVRKLADVDQA
jgi:uncharacterized membrane protein YgaE (UPF0421/DUF939 family)